MILSLNSDPMTLNPVIAQDGQSLEVISFIFNSLLKFDEDLNIVPDLAYKWEVLEKGKVCIFHLRKNVLWHDGNEFTAKDVKFTFDKLMDSSTNTFNRGYFQINGRNIDFEIIDKYTIKAVLPEPFAPFSSYIAMIGIIPEHIYRNRDINICEFNSSPVGTGPFKFKKWLSSDHIILTANKNYFKSKPKLDRVVFRIIPSSEVKTIALKTREIDQGKLKTEDVAFVEKINYLKIYKTSSFMYYYLGFDLTNPLFADKNVRKAINYSIDRKKLVRAVLNDTAVVATGPIPLASWAYTDKVIKYDYDPDKAVKLLNASGWKKGRSGYLEKDGRIFEFQLDYPLGRSEFQKSAVIINGYLSEIGIKSVLRGVEFNVLLRKCYPGKFEAVLLDWIENYDPDCFVEWDSSQTGNKGMNFMSYINPVTDEILMKARKTLDIQKRKYLYHKFQKIIADDSPYVFLWYPSNIYAFNKRIMGISRPNPVGIFLNPERLYIK